MNYKLVYRRYAGLFFTIAVDSTDNELAYLETIHLFVELLDKYFSNVCELDIVFNFNKVRAMLCWGASPQRRSSPVAPVAIAGVQHPRRVHPRWRGI